MKYKIAEKLLSIRKNYNLTQAQMADKIGVIETTYNKWERGKIQPNLASLLMIAVAFDLTLDELVGLDEVMNNE